MKAFGSNVVRTVFLVAILAIAMERQAKAYTDPGTGALLWQMLVAVFAGGLFYCRKITFWLRNRRGPKD